MKRIGWLSACLIVLASVSAFAENNGDGLLNSVSYKPLPANMPIAVRAMDNSDENMVLVREFEGALRAGGYTVSPGADLILTFETRDELGAWSDHGKRTLLELSAKGGYEGGEDAKARFNVYNSQKGGILNKGRGGTSITTPSQYRIDVTIEDKTNGKSLWQAWAVADLGASDGAVLVKNMVPVLVKHLGQTVKQQSFTVR
ncbi:MAG: hypothetical protein A3G18_09155 [Rhodospirillales bacterium RIFCSPLOWO2_12_FULL_58_28]|nr:MAG: hypothetical protein A3H92_13400 [Rhodospirillales bacterium RIFCSPLOWO2_02_FULL_58_16]OHC76668.1 MAG: hypothetical protein A3G18_09155 [Rhodospirillales bacterium RIFCSPLOWO2_12_FULL_58_28]